MARKQAGKRKAQRRAPKPALCWRHQLGMFWAATGSLLDLTGRSFRPAADRVFRQAHACERCEYRRSW